MGQIIGWYWLEHTPSDDRKVTVVLDDGRLSSRCTVAADAPDANNIERATTIARAGAEKDLNQLRRAVNKLEKE